MDEDIKDLEPQINNDKSIESYESDDEGEESDNENLSEGDEAEEMEEEEVDEEEGEEEEEEEGSEHSSGEEANVSDNEDDSNEGIEEEEKGADDRKTKIMDSVFVVEKMESQEETEQDTEKIENGDGRGKKNKLTKLKNKLKEQIQKQTKRGKSLVKARKQKSEIETDIMEADKTTGPFTQLDMVKHLEYGQEESEGSVQINTSDEDTPFEDEQILVKTPPQRKKMVANVGKYTPLVSTFKSPSGSFTVSSLTENPSVKTVHKGMSYFCEKSTGLSVIIIIVLFIYTIIYFLSPTESPLELKLILFNSKV